jgi:hypothetical protein
MRGFTLSLAGLPCVYACGHSRTSGAATPPTAGRLDGEAPCAPTFAEGRECGPVPRTVAATFDPQVPPGQELRKRAAPARVRAPVEALAEAPREAIDVTAANGCVACGSLNPVAGDPSAAANALADPAKVAACEWLLEAPAPAGALAP